MEAIEKLDPKYFKEYIDKYHNTICGRHPIGVLLHVSNYTELTPSNLNSRQLKSYPDWNQS